VANLGNLILIKKNEQTSDCCFARNGRLPWSHDQRHYPAKDHRPAGAGPADQSPLAGSVHFMRVILPAIKLFYQSKIAD
jgi:hypothetical protein